jgi:citrate lyase subunit beta/citryl-CoA lyase
VVLAKAEDEAAVTAVADAVGHAGGRLGLMIETATGLSRVRELASHPSVDVLVYGSADFRLSIGARADPERSWERAALFEILLAARTHGCAAVDSVYFRFRDDEGLAHDARIARGLGFDGKSCIHPGQVATIHRVFASDPEEVAWARAVLAAWSDQDGERRGIVTLDGGEMIEELHLRMARRILDRDTR